MSLLAFLLVILSAFFHAFWNFLTKKVAGNFFVLYNGLFFVVLIGLPITLFSVWDEESIVRIFPIILCSVTVHLLYYWALLKAYRFGDISLVYPVARGSSVAITACLGLSFLHNTISTQGWLGIVFIVLGTLLLGLGVDIAGSFLVYGRIVLFSLFIGVLIAVYSVLDSFCVRSIDPFSYIILTNGLYVLALLPWIVVTKQAEEIRQSWQDFKWYSIVIGLGLVGTYLIILYVFQLAQVSYVVALREVGIAFGALLGFRFLGEKCSVIKVMGIISIIIGMVLIKIA